MSIPFENLDPYSGIPVSVALDDVADKLVRRRRGGYCFEQNLLFKAAVEETGARVDMFLARVRAGAPPGAVARLSHLVLRVALNDHVLLADVGFGRNTLLEPIPFEPDGVHTQNGWSFRVVDEDTERVLQLREKDEWTDLYGFRLTPVPLIDIETSNWWVCTNPNSNFVKGLVTGIQSEDGAHMSLSDWSGELALVKSLPDSAERTVVTRDQIPDLLARHFNLGGFALNAQGKLVAT
jgi:arylamine N-acetyltransferase